MLAHRKRNKCVAIHLAQFHLSSLRGSAVVMCGKAPPFRKHYLLFGLRPQWPINLPTMGAQPLSLCNSRKGGAFPHITAAEPRKHQQIHRPFFFNEAFNTQYLQYSARSFSLLALNQFNQLKPFRISSKLIPRQLEQSQEK